MATLYEQGMDLPFGPSRRTVITVGTFDGLHLGHREILKQVEQTAKKMNAEPVLVTFDPHPRHVVSGKSEPKLLTTREEKIEILKSFFSGSIVILPFDSTLQGLSARDFVKDILIARFAPVHMVIGYDHAFGRNRGGTTGDLQLLGEELDFTVDVVEPILLNGKPNSSSRIRAALAEGNLPYANELLGSSFGILGIVEKGIGKGHELGFPTANLGVPREKLIPREGVYACTAVLHGEGYPGVLFMGTNYLNPEEKQTIEVHLFNFNRDIYTSRLWLYPSAYLRENRRFESVDALIAQIRKDTDQAMTMMTNTQYMIKE